MKRAAILLCATLLLSACGSKGFNDWSQRVNDAQQDWENCALNATEHYGKTYQNPELVGNYAMHKCEEWKKKYIETVLWHKGVEPASAFAATDKLESQMRDKMKMLATKWQADFEAQLNAQFPTPLQFRDEHR
ncbi:MAG: hypothetical protein Q8O00_11160 [Holophaga sp.]|nr:hypothetical protein [Holophaga sp.]